MQSIQSMVMIIPIILTFKKEFAIKLLGREISIVQRNANFKTMISCERRRINIEEFNEFFKLPYPKLFEGIVLSHTYVEEESEEDTDEVEVHEVNTSFDDQQHQRKDVETSLYHVQHQHFHNDIPLYHEHHQRVDVETSLYHEQHQSVGYVCVVDVNTLHYHEYHHVHFDDQQNNYFERFLRP